MQEKKRSELGGGAPISSPPSRSSHELAFVPFSWEEKPGVPKHHPPPAAALINLSLHSEAYHILHSPLRKPPCLQLPFPPSFHHLPPPPSSSPKLLVRKQSLNNILSTTSSTIKPLSRKFSHGNLHLRPSFHHGGTSVRMEDDPFFMAIQACRKGYSTSQQRPIKVYYHDGHVRPRNVDDMGDARLRSHSSEVEELKHPTIRQLFTQQLQEEEEQVKKGQRQPLIVSTSQKKHGKGPFSMLARCFVCY